MQFPVTRLFAPIILSIFFLATPLLASAATYYVATTGSDSASCGASASPCRTITYAYDNKVVAGDTLLVQPGTYTDYTTGWGINLTKKGTATAPITLKSVVKGAAIIDGGAVTAYGTRYTCFAVNATYTVIDGFTIRNCLGGGISVNDWWDGTPSSHNTFINNEIYNISNPGVTRVGQGGQGIGEDQSSVGNYYGNNYIHNIGTSADTKFDHGMYLGGSNDTVVNNIVTHNVYGNGLQIAGYTNAHDYHVYNNTFAYNGYHGIILWQTVDRAQIYNNISAFNGGFGISLCSDISEGSVPGYGTNDDFRNNVLYSNTLGTLVNSCDSPAWGPYTNTGMITTNPLLVSSTDFHLQNTSPAIDTGVNDGVTTDFAGTTRPQGTAWDIGAYEYKSVAPASSANPVGYWKLDDGSGATALDSSGNGHTGTLVNSPTWVTGKVGSALSFNGATQYVNIGDPASGVLDPGTGSFTFSLWAYTSTSPATGTWYTPWYKGGSSLGSIGYDMEVNSDNNWYADLSDGTHLVFGNFITATPTLNQWILLTAVVDRSAQQLRTYTNGVLAGQANISTIGSLSSANPARIGAGRGLYFNGKIDDVRVYNRALSATEVLALYNNATPTPAPTPVPDTTAPSVPTGLTATATSSQINLTWTASTDNVGVTGYKMFRDGAQIGTSVTTSYSDTGLAASTVYSYTVAAYDAAGNTSAPSAAVSAITKSAAAQTIAIGGRVITTANLNVRSAASPGAAKLGTEPVGSLGTVIAGPTAANGYNWWKVSWDDGLSGWSIGNYLKAVSTASSPAVGLSEQSSLALSKPDKASLIHQLLEQIQVLIAQVQNLQAQVAAAGGVFAQ